ncbi:MAG: ABC-2 transporter permease [Peptoniphilus sp.]|nr:ABC-2 transporter permease [Peptoniphilus sp.]
MTRSLMYKDIVNIVRSNESKHMMIIFPLIFGAMFYLQGESAAIGYLSVIFFSLLLNTFSKDEEALCYSYLKSTPVKAKSIVRAKFALVILFQIFAFVLMFVISFVINAVLGLKSVDDSLMFITEIATVIYVITVLYLLYIPLIFKYGAKKSVIAIAALFFVLMVIVMLFIDKFKVFFSKIDLSQNIPIAAVVLVGILLSWLSYIISIKIVKSKG